MKKEEFKRIIKECLDELYGGDREVSARVLKIGDRVMYNEHGPFEVVGITPDFSLRNITVVKLQLPNNSEKWAEIKVDNNAKYFTKV